MDETKHSKTIFAEIIIYDPDAPSGEKAFRIMKNDNFLNDLKVEWTEVYRRTEKLVNVKGKAKEKYFFAKVEKDVQSSRKKNVLDFINKIFEERLYGNMDKEDVENYDSMVKELPPCFLYFIWNPPVYLEHSSKPVEKDPLL